VIESLGDVNAPATARALLFVCVLVLLPSACAPQPLSVTREPTSLHIVGADSCATLMRDAAATYEEDHLWVTVTSQVLNNALAAEALQEERADLALLSWDSLGTEEHGLWMEPVGRDGVAVIVHPASSFSKIGMAQLREIYRGRLQEHQGDVLTVVSREEGSGTRAALESIVLNGEGTTLNAVVMPSSEAMVDYVAGTPGTIGYVSTRCLDDRVRTLSVEGVQPTESAVASGRYPLWRELHVASRGDPTGEARQFAQWLIRGGGAAD